jgi:uncharacterized protein (TIGR03089 family)
VAGERTVGAMFAEAVRRDPASPAFTFYDDATGERTELSGATLGNWVAKTANMLVDDCHLEPGQWASVGLPPHWQTAAVLLGCWTAGVAVTAAPDPADVAFVDLTRAAQTWPATDRYVLGLHPLALPLPTVPDGHLDFTTEVRAHGDYFFPAGPIPPQTAAWRAGNGDVAQVDLVAQAADRAAALGIAAGARVLIDLAAHPDPVDWLLAPLAAGASTVACRHLDTTKLGARADAELVTQQLAS